MAMAFKIEFYDMRILILMLFGIPLITATNIDCNGKAFHCVNTTHFMICVDLGGGVSKTVDSFVIPCPPTTGCLSSNKFECEYLPVTTTVPTILTSAVTDNDITESAATLAWEQIAITTNGLKSNEVELSEKYYDTVNGSTLPIETSNNNAEPTEEVSATPSKDTNVDEVLVLKTQNNDVATEVVETLPTENVIAITDLRIERNTDETTMPPTSTNEVIFKNESSFTESIGSTNFINGDTTKSMDSIKTAPAILTTTFAPITSSTILEEKYFRTENEPNEITLNTNTEATLQMSSSLLDTSFDEVNVSTQSNKEVTETVEALSLKKEITVNTDLAQQSDTTIAPNSINEELAYTESSITETMGSTNFIVGDTTVLPYSSINIKDNSAVLTTTLAPETKEVTQTFENEITTILEENANTVSKNNIEAVTDLNAVTANMEISNELTGSEVTIPPYITTLTFDEKDVANPVTTENIAVDNKTEENKNVEITATTDTVDNNVEHEDAAKKIETYPDTTYVNTKTDSDVIFYTESKFLQTQTNTDLTTPLPNVLNTIDSSLTIDISPYQDDTLSTTISLNEEVPVVPITEFFVENRNSTNLPNSVNEIVNSNQFYPGLTVSDIFFTTNMEGSSSQTNNVIEEKETTVNYSKKYENNLINDSVTISPKENANITQVSFSNDIYKDALLKGVTTESTDNKDSYLDINNTETTNLAQEIPPAIPQLNFNSGESKIDEVKNIQTNSSSTVISDVTLEPITIHETLGVSLVDEIVQFNDNLTNPNEITTKNLKHILQTTDSFEKPITQSVTESININNEIAEIFPQNTISNSTKILSPIEHSGPDIINNMIQTGDNQNHGFGITGLETIVTTQNILSTELGAAQTKTNDLMQRAEAVDTNTFMSTSDANLASEFVFTTSSSERINNLLQQAKTSASSIEDPQKYLVATAKDISSTLEPTFTTVIGESYTKIDMQSENVVANTEELRKYLESSFPSSSDVGYKVIGEQQPEADIESSDDTLKDLVTSVISDNLAVQPTFTTSSVLGYTSNDVQQPKEIPINTEDFGTLVNSGDSTFKSTFVTDFGSEYTNNDMQQSGLAVQNTEELLKKIVNTTADINLGPIYSQKDLATAATKIDSALEPTFSAGLNSSILEQDLVPTTDVDTALEPTFVADFDSSTAQQDIVTMATDINSVLELTFAAGLEPSFSKQDSVTASPDINSAFEHTFAAGLEPSFSKQDTVTASPDINLAFEPTFGADLDSSTAQQDIVTMATDINSALEPTFAAGLEPSFSEQDSVTAAPGINSAFETTFAASLEPSFSKQDTVTASPDINSAFEPTFGAGLEPSFSNQNSVTASTDINSALEPTFAAGFEPSFSKQDSVTASPDINAAFEPTFAVGLEQSFSKQDSVTASIDVNSALEPTFATGSQPAYSQKDLVTAATDANTAFEPMLATSTPEYTNKDIQQSEVADANNKSLFIDSVYPSIEIFKPSLMPELELAKKVNNITETYNPDLAATFSTVENPKSGMQEPQTDHTNPLQDLILYSEDSEIQNSAVTITISPEKYDGTVNLLEVTDNKSGSINDVSFNIEPETKSTLVPTAKIDNSFKMTGRNEVTSNTGIEYITPIKNGIIRNPGLENISVESVQQSVFDSRFVTKSPVNDYIQTTPYTKSLLTQDSVDITKKNDKTLPEHENTYANQENNIDDVKTAYGSTKGFVSLTSAESKLKDIATETKNNNFGAVTQTDENFEVIKNKYSTEQMVTPTAKQDTTETITSFSLSPNTMPFTSHSDGISKKSTQRNDVTEINHISDSISTDASQGIYPTAPTEKGTASISIMTTTSTTNIPNTHISVQEPHAPSLSSSNWETTKPTATLSVSSEPSSPVFNCLGRYRGRYADQEDCSRFFVCIGIVQPIIGVCPANTVFSDLKKQCTKNLSHCIRGSELQCVSEGRFSDIHSTNIYFICIKDRFNKFYRFKFQCQSGYHFNKTTMRCLKSQIVASISASNDSTSKSESENPISTSNNKSKEADSKKFECEEEGRYPYPGSCRKYYQCTKKKSGFRRKTKKCDSDELFHKDKKRCVDADSYEC